VVLVSASMGSIGVLRHLATGDESREVAGVVTVSCPARWRLPRNARGVLSALMTSTAPGRWATSRYVGVRVARPRPRPAPPIDLVPRIGVPVAIVHGRADPFIPVADAELLFAAAPDPKRLMLVDRLGHAFEPPAIPPVLESVAWILDQP
jgi:pimeloyl-ACP methyl ester carboxylesterase